ncbi:hypothetical protein V5E97_40005 (plasmid) [Singulisphaera sp. Ch08]|uniref:Uncharacterized protein n=1 Tax=Singulisphaera sp. Ch08 TaxID=3120278 RepID=A0AAU7CTU6_9BACT
MGISMMSTLSAFLRLAARLRPLLGTREVAISASFFALGDSTDAIRRALRHYHKPALLTCEYSTPGLQRRAMGLSAG